MGGVALNLRQKPDLVLAQGDARDLFDRVLREELGQRDIHGAGDLLQRLQRRHGVAVLYPRKVAAQQAGTLLDVALRHPPLQPVAADGHANLDRARLRGNRRKVLLNCMHIRH